MNGSTTGNQTATMQQQGGLLGGLGNLFGSFLSPLLGGIAGNLTKGKSAFGGV